MFQGWRRSRIPGCGGEDVGARCAADIYLTVQSRVGGEGLERQLPVQCAESNKPRASPSQGGSVPHTSREEVMNRSEGS